MSSNQIKSFSFNFFQRNAPKNGPFSSDAWNDSMKELATDLANLTKEWNDKVVPMTAALPYGEKDTNIDALKYGIDGENVWVNSEALSTDTDNRFYNLAADRPYTIAEALRNIYTYADGLASLGPRTADLDMGGYNMTNAAGIQASRDIEVTDSSYGLVLRSSTGERWRITIDTSGQIIATLL